MRKAALALVLTLAATAAFGADENCPPRYSYCGYSGPEQWKNLPISDNECGGQVQSPVDVTGWTVRPGGPAITVSYNNANVSIDNTGHDIEVRPVGNPGFITIDGTRYDFEYFHFHHPSEHKLEGHQFPAELHLVHKDQSGHVAVIAVLLEVGKSSPVLAEVFRNLPLPVCRSASTAIELSRLLPATITSYYTYDGSLTTPPCSQNVTFYIANGTGITLSQDEYDKLVALGENARPLQDLNKRQIWLIEPAQ